MALGDFWRACAKALGASWEHECCHGLVRRMIAFLGGMYCFGHSVPVGFLRSDSRGEKVHKQDQAHPNPCTKLGVPASLGSHRVTL